jgi:hypothetical protein
MILYSITEFTFLVFYVILRHFHIIIIIIIIISQITLSGQFELILQACGCNACYILYWNMTVIFSIESK